MPSTRITSVKGSACTLPRTPGGPTAQRSARSTRPSASTHSATRKYTSVPTSILCCGLRLLTQQCCCGTGGRHTPHTQHASRQTACSPSRCCPAGHYYEASCGCSWGHPQPPCHTATQQTPHRVARDQIGADALGAQRGVDEAQHQQADEVGPHLVHSPHCRQAGRGTWVSSGGGRRDQ